MAEKKKDDSELNAWRYRYPSAGVSWNLTGDPAYCQQFIGEAKAMLYQVKNRMNIAVPKLKSLEDGHRCEDGTTIIVGSIFGQDFINIDVSKSIMLGQGQKCTITFLDLPDYVQPMKYPGEIHIGEVQGTDYIKTYYRVDLKNCNNCQDIAWEFLLAYSIPVEPRHYHNYGSIPQMGVPPGGDDPNNHSVYSLEPPCWAEIINRGTDSGGNYIIWKAHTEMGDASVYSRTGLAIPLLRAVIKAFNGIELCKQEKKFDVDCCKKKADLRKVEIWWEGVWICEPFIIYGDSHICKMPSEVAIGGSNGLIAYSTPFYAARPLYSIPNIKGGCLPLVWSVSGPILLINPSPMGTSTFFQITDGACNSPVIITLKDRCGTQDIVRGRPCCEDAAALSITYTSLLMSCGQSQDLQVSGGCGPYSWSLSGGGTLNTDTGLVVTYHAPATNANCTDNPTITVSDCCGNSADIKLAINCYNTGTALEMSESFDCGCLSCNQTPCDYCSPPCMGHKRQHRNRDWKCDGTLVTDCSPGGGMNCVGYMTIACKSNCECDPTFYMDCHTGDCGGSAPCNTMKDMRSGPMKTAGCCPLNPLTGQPYD